MENIRKRIKEINKITEEYQVFCRRDDERGRYLMVTFGKLDKENLPWKTYNTVEELICEYDHNYEKNCFEILKEFESRIKTYIRG